MGINAPKHDLRAPGQGILPTWKSKPANAMVATGDATIEVLGEAGNHPQSRVVAARDSFYSLAHSP